MENFYSSKLFIIFILMVLQIQLSAQNCNNLSTSYSISMSNNGCGSPSNISITNTSTGVASVSSTYYWIINNSIFDTTYALASPSSISKTSGNYEIKMIAVTSSNCKDTVTQNISISPQPSANFTMTSDTICVGSRVLFSSTSTNTTSNTSYNWSFGNNNSLSNYGDTASQSYNSSGSYSVKLTVVNQVGCADSISKTITVQNGGNPLRFYDGNGTPQYYVTWSRCINLITTPDSFSQVFASPDTIFNYVVDYGDGNTETGDTLLPYSNGFLQHVYYSTGVYDFVVISRDVNGCDRLFHGKVINLRVPTVGIGGPHSGSQNGCVPMTTGFYNSSSNVSGNTTFTWDYGDGTTGVFDTSNVSDSVSHIYYTSVCNIYITLTAENECGNTQSTWGPVNAFSTDEAHIAGTTTLCYPDTTAILSIASQMNCYSGVRHYYWDFGDGINTGWSTLPLPQSHNFPDTGTYQVVLIDSNICGIDSSTASVTIYLPPEAEFTADTVCLGEQTNFIDQSTIVANNGSISNYTWNFGDGNTSSQQNPQHQYLGYGTYNVTLTVESEHGCFDVIQHQVIVKESPAVSYATSPGFNICDSNNIAFQGNVTLNTTTVDSIRWDFGDGSDTNIMNPTHAFSPNGTYSVRFYIIADNGCSAYDSNVVNVYSSPNASFSADSICFGDQTHFVDHSITNDGENIISWKWDFNSDGIIDNTSQNPAYYFPSFGTYIITLIVTTEYGCIDTVSETSMVHPNPVVNFSNSQQQICSYDSIQFTNQSITADSFLWTFGDGDSLATSDTSSFWHNFNSAGNYYTKLTAFNNHGCSAKDSTIINIKSSPTSAFVSNTTSGCEPLNVSFSNTSSNASSYYWNFGNGITSNQSDTSITYQSVNYLDSNYVVTLISEKNGCYDTVVHYISIYHRALALFTINPDSGCSPLFVQTSNNSLGSDSFYWSCTSGDTSTATSPYFNFGNYLFQDITYDLTLFAYTEHNCYDTAKTQIKVKPSPFALFTSNMIQGCPPLAINFSNQSIIGNFYFWDFGDGTTSSLENPSHTFAGTNSDTNYLVKLYTYSNNGCVDSFSKNINVFSIVEANFSKSDTACVPVVIQFNDQSTNASYWNWSFGDGGSSTSQNPTHTYTNPGTYSISLHITNQKGCSDTLTLSNVIKVNPNPIAVFTNNVNQGCEPLQIHFTNYSTVADSFYWEFGDGDTSTLTNPLHTFTTPNMDTAYTVVLYAFTNEGCIDSFIKTINVYKSVQAYFNQSDSICSPLNIQFIDSSSFANSWLWDFGNGNSSTLQNPSQIYTQAGTYSVQLIASNYRCKDTFGMLNNIKVWQNPDASFTVNKNNGCEALAINFTNQSSNFDSIYWDFGDLQNSANLHPLHSFTTAENDTSYQVKLITLTTHGCIDSMTKSIDVYKSATAFFNTIDSGCSPLAIQFIDSSSYATNYFWDFGNGNTSTQKSPSQIYSQAGTYSVSLVASNYRCKDTFEIIDAIKVWQSPEAQFAINNSAGCEPLNVSFTNQSAYADSFLWYFESGSLSGAKHPNYSFTTPIQDTVFTIKLTVITDKACTDSITRSVDVYKAATAYFNTTDSSCAPSDITFQNLSSFSNFWLWDFGNGKTSTAENPNHLYSNPGTYSVSLIASNYRCSDTFDLKNNITVWQNPVSLFSTNKIQGCEPLLINFNDQSVFADNYEWDFGNNQNDTNRNTSHIFQAGFADTTYQVNLKVITINGCTDSFVRPITVFKSVNAYYQTYDTGCAPLRVSFTDQSSDALFWLWEFGDGNASTVQNPDYTFYKHGDYSIRLIASNNHCSDTFKLTKNIQVWEVPSANFISNKDTVIFPNRTFSFYTLSKKTLYHHWDFDDGYSDNSLDPVHTFPDTGNYYVNLIVNDIHCYDTATHKVRVVPPVPIPDFSFQPNNGCIPLEVHFEDLSQYASAWIWSFGDGNTSKLKNPVYTYKVPGTYNVTLITSNNIGTTNITKMQIINVYPQPTVFFDVTPEIAYLPNPLINLLNKSLGAETYEWYIDGNFVSNNENADVTYSFPGYHDVTLIGISDKGCKDTLTRMSIIRIDSQGEIYVPTAFTPSNNDGLNDIFIPKMYGYSAKEYRFVVFDRWGERIFESTNPEVGWDGKYKGSLCENELYYWIVQVKLFSEGDKVFDGKVHLLR
ncbi:MAG: PKD domain-containing protein [Bacteroidota bacterium]|nr:PKD domain-containing protein [Bacteroidota bacterium]